MISFKNRAASMLTAALVVGLGIASLAFAGGINGPGPITVFQYAPAGARSALDITAASVVKAAPGVVMKILVVAAGSGGSLTINDATTTGGATTANEIFTEAQSTLSVGQVITLEFPAQNGIVVSAVPTGSPQFSISYN